MCLCRQHIVKPALDATGPTRGKSGVSARVRRFLNGERRQLTTYSYNANSNNYAYVTVGDPGEKPTSGTMEIQGKIWTYSFSYLAQNGKTVQMHITNDFTEAGLEKFKVESSDDGGTHWKTVMEGSAKKLAE